MATFGTAQNLVPEAILLAGAIVCAALGAAGRARRRSMRPPMIVASVALLAAALSSLVYLRGMPGQGYDSYSSGLVVDRFTAFVLPVLCGFTLLTVLSGDLIAERVRPHGGEYHALLLLATLGGVLLAAARDMIALYIALELLSVCLYVAVGMIKTDRRGSEAAFKYLVLGAASSAVLLYGLAILYGLSGSTVLTDVAGALGHTGAASALGIALVLAGLSFKLGAVPFQQWVPDVYEGAPAPVAGLIATMSKTAGFAVVARVAVTTFGASSTTWTAVIAVVAVASMVYGNLAALAQRRLRRLLAYSSIGQVGFILMGLLGHGQAAGGVGASLFYLLSYGVTVIGAFAAITAVEAAGVGDDIESYRGLSARAPLPAAVLGVAMVSLIGVPPLAGFFAKLLVFQSATIGGWSWMLVVAVAMTVVSAAYYLRVLRAVFVDAPVEGAAALEAEPLPLRGVLAASVAATVILGVAAQPLLHVASTAGAQLP